METETKFLEEIVFFASNSDLKEGETLRVYRVCLNTVYCFTILTRRNNQINEINSV